MKTIIYDLETTGLRPKADKIIELYAYDVKDKTCLHLKINPECDIPPESTKIHGFTNMDLDKEKKFKDVTEDILDFFGEDAYLISHNNDGFDKKFLLIELYKAGIPRPTKWKFVDTLKLARIKYPNLDNYKQGTLQNMLDIPVSGNHRANKDVLDLVKIYEHMTEGMTIKEIYKMSKNFVYDTMVFGKHAGTKLEDLPRGYIKWLENGILKEDKTLRKSFEVKKLIST